MTNEEAIKRRKGLSVTMWCDYEDTGLEPEDVEQLKAVAFNTVKLTAINEVPVGHVADLLSAEKEGRLVVLPCKVGDPMAWVHDRTMTPVHVHRIQINKRGTFLVLKSTVVHGAFPVDQIGKTIFLTNAEAKAELDAVAGIT